MTNKTLDLHDFLALPLTPCIRLRINPETEIEIDQAAVEGRRQEVLDFCRAIPDADRGLSWLQLKSYTGGNGVLAKVLIALGEYVGAWRMHPSVQHEVLWRNSRTYPMILAGSVTKEEKPSHPSEKDLETTSKECLCCGVKMGPSTSLYHDIVEGDREEGICRECEFSGCSAGGPCRQGEKKVKKAAAKKLEEPSEESEMGPNINEKLLARYLKQFE